MNPLTKLAAYHNALNTKDMAAVESMFAEDAEYCSPGIKGSLMGRANIMKAFRAYFAEFADQVSTNDLVELLEPLRVRTYWHLFATSKLSGRPLRRQGIEITTFNKQGMITCVEVEDVGPME